MSDHNSRIVAPPVLEGAKVIFISRGHGRGHAVPDIAIAREVQKQLPKLSIRFVSYAAGADVYRSNGLQVFDMGAPDLPPFLDMVVAFTRVLGSTAAPPDLIVSHEEFPALPAAAILNIPCLFITDFFADPSSITMRALKYAEAVIFTCERGVYTEPPFLQGRVCYVGRAVRRTEFSLADRARARSELEIPPDAAVVLVQPGAWSELQVPMAQLLIAAWRLVADAPKRMMWLAGREFASLKDRYGAEPHVFIVDEDWNIGRLMAASNVLITKANRITVYEAAALGLPSISISNMVNWPDDVAVANVPSNLSLMLDSLTPQALADAIHQSLSLSLVPADSVSCGISGAAAEIVSHLNRLNARSAFTCRPWDCWSAEL